MGYSVEPTWSCKDKLFAETWKPPYPIMVFITCRPALLSSAERIGTNVLKIVFTRLTGLDIDALKKPSAESGRKISCWLNALVSYNRLEPDASCWKFSPEERYPIRKRPRAAPLPRAQT